MPTKVINNQATCANIQKMLEEKGFTPRDVKERLNLASVQSVYKWYATARGKGSSMPSVDNMVILSQMLETTVDKMLVTNNVLS